MMYSGRFLFFVRSEGLLCARSHLLSFHQNISKHMLKRLKETIFPLRPKKPVPPFLMYIRQVKPRFAEESPGIKYTEILQRAASEWSKLDVAEKENFVNEYNKSYKIYMEKLREYKNSLTEEQKQLWEQKKKEYEQVNSKKKYEILGRPKRPINAYLSYLSSKRKDKDPDMHVKDWIKSMTENWNKLPDKEKEPYFTEAMQLKAQYHKDLEKWEMEMIRSGNSDIVRSKTLLKYKNANCEEQQ
ncbi:transcription factor A, mitochondrial-like [Frieseomelitta varia]|uniref:transcription factor A, mitochondrial-like n=1 Tax=Frieseomelitta varia TaxID=561572 RepID=UPI001CB691E1|nr:transcription factor A, mitochondrial-like [Frieseomelitta varia]